MPQDAPKGFQGCRVKVSLCLLKSLFKLPDSVSILDIRMDFERDLVELKLKGIGPSIPEGGVYPLRTLFSDGLVSWTEDKQ
jgi:hypothetical protein